MATRPRRDSNVGFTIAVDRFVQKATENIDMVRKTAAIELFSKIIDGTPVSRIEFVDAEYLGIAKGGWNASTNTPDYSYGSNDTEGTKTKDAMEKIVLSADIGEDIYLANGVPYIGTLEYGGYPSPVERGSYNRITKKFEILSDGGYSKQAPTGWVRNATTGWQSFVDFASKKVIK